MPKVIDYSTVLATLQNSGLRCVYPNSGAFGLPEDVAGHAVGWIARDDPTIRGKVRKLARIVPPPAAPSLAAMLGKAWAALPPGPLWLMPASHWAYELQFGGDDWLPALLAEHGVDPDGLRNHSDGSAIEFQNDEATLLATFVESLFDRMKASDFNIAFPGQPVIALLHHHQQVWWQTSDEKIVQLIDAVV